MDDLRLILALLGLGVVLGVYTWTRIQQSPPRPRRKPPPRYTRVDDEPDEQAIERELARMGQLVADRDPDFDTTVESGETGQQAAADTQPLEDRLLVISVVAEDATGFSGADLAKAFENNGLVFGEHDIYHRVVDINGARRSVFCVANLVKPGTFSPPEMDTFTSPGITLFLQLPGVIDAVEAFDDFVTTAERLAVELAGGLRDEHRNVLTHQVLMQVRQGLVDARTEPRAAS
jgi:cell division protein ZipA